MPIALRLLAALAPLLLSVLFAYLLTGPLSFGGGEKDILLAVPVLAWSVVYLVCFLVLWLRRRPIRWSLAVSASVATGLLLASWLALLVFVLATRP